LRYSEASFLEEETMSDLQEKFQKAAKDVQSLRTRPDNDTLLKLYALFKQGTAGEVCGKRPGLIDFKGRAKFDAWAALKGKSQETAMQEYVGLVEQLLAR
jgi:diazepam-binding inhibitor (GABA receptor modulator, acyl-CoA-binding protein)